MLALTKLNFLLLDSCIAEYLLDSYLSEPLSNQIELWNEEKLGLSISEISFAELMNGANKPKIKRVEELLDTFSCLEVTRRILSGSAIIANVYRKKYSQILGADMADRIISATSFVYNLPLLTANVRDFPHPFFTSYSSHNVEFRKKNKKHLLTIDILKPNTSQLNYWYSRSGWKHLNRSRSVPLAPQTVFDLPSHHRCIKWALPDRSAKAAQFGQC